MIDERLKKQIEFIVETDKLKNIYRQTYVINEDRKENDSEHSWHLALMAFILAEHSNVEIDVLKTIKMVLIHDIVEIDAGDTYCYDKEGYKDKAEREGKAAERIFGILPDDQRDEMFSLWQEFEAMNTPESKFAAALDRVQPLTLNYRKGGVSWKEHKVTKDMVLERNSHIADGSDEIWKYAEEIINDAELRGFFR